VFVLPMSGAFATFQRQGLHSRMDLFRKSQQAFLARAGEADIAAMLATADA
jgi:hypothetical protein